MQADFEEEERGKSLQDYLDIWQRRKWPMLAIMAAIFLVAVLIALVLPPVYRSTATILIEDQDIPRELVQSTVTSYAAQRIEIINREVMTRSNLLQLIERHNLFPEERGKVPVENLIGKMRQAINLEMISAEVIDPRSGRPMEATIAFTISFDAGKPEIAQRITNDLVSLYLSENIKRRTRKAIETTEFLAQEEEKLRERLTEIEQKIADFKARHASALPEYSQMNIQLAERTRQDLSDIDRQLRALRERRYYLEGQLAVVNPNAPIVSPDGQLVMDDAERLRMLRSEYARVSAKYGPNHPDVKRLRREIAALEQGGAETRDIRDPRELELDRLRVEYAEARNRYSEQHPDVIKLKRRINNLEADLRESPPVRRGAGANPVGPATNPAFIALQSQLKSVDSEISSLQLQRRELKAQIARYEKSIAISPEIEKEYTNLLRDKESVERRLREIAQKLMEARLSQDLEQESKAERFTLLEPALLPEKPIKPNRVAIIFLGGVLSVAMAIAYAMLAEAMSKGVFGRHQLATLLKEPPLAVIPYIETEADLQHQRRVRLVMVALVVLGMVLFLGALHYFWKPLDVIWFSAMRNVGM